MILQTLAEYHRMQVANGNPNYAPSGMELKRIHFVLVLSSDGILVDIEKLDDKVCVAKSFERGGVDASSRANRMWDSVGYVTGYSADITHKKTAATQHNSFVELVKTIHREYPENKSFAAVANFYTSYVTQLYNHPKWAEIILKPGYNISFRLLGDSLLASQQKDILTYGSLTKQGRCIVSGRKTEIAHTHPKLHITGCSPTGAKLVSFNKVSGYDSFCKKGTDNAPTSVAITESYTAALTGILQLGSENRVVVNSVTLIFYTFPDSDFNKLFSCLFGASSELNRHKVLRTLKDNISNYSDSEFVLIALVPNVARISVRLHIKSTVAKIAANILRFYEEISLEKSNESTDTISILAFIFALARRDNIKSLPPQLIIDFIEAVVCGTRIPVLFQQELLRNLSKKMSMAFVIYSMLKCYQIRNIKTHVSMSLDKENRNIGYVLGRLLAISERAQELSSPNVSFTIRDMFYGIMSVTPSYIFAKFIGTTGVFIRRIPTQGSTIFMKVQFGEVMQMLDGNGVPVRLSLDQQSFFAIGYFHQRQTYFKKKENNEQDN